MDSRGVQSSQRRSRLFCASCCIMEPREYYFHHEIIVSLLRTMTLLAILSAKRWVLCQSRAVPVCLSERPFTSFFQGDLLCRRNRRLFCFHSVQLASGDPRRCHCAQRAHRPTQLWLRFRNRTRFARWQRYQVFPLERFRSGRERFYLCAPF